MQISAGCLLTNALHASGPTTTQSTQSENDDILSTREPGLSDFILQSEEELILKQLAGSGGQFVISISDCGDNLALEPCSLIQSVERITRSEWEQLFSHTDFYIIRTITYTDDVPYQHNLLLVRNDKDGYVPVSIPQLLNVNGVVISAENYEAMARSLVMMELPDFIEYEVRFLDWEEGSWPSPIRMSFNYRMIAWTQLGGFKIQYYFLFHEGQLLGAEGRILDEEYGDFITIPLEGPRAPSSESLTYWFTE